MKIDGWIMLPFGASTLSQRHYEWPGGGATITQIDCRATESQEEREAARDMRNLGWMRLSEESFRDDWDNPLDAGYDNL